MDEYLETMADEMRDALDSLSRALAKVRTGRATPALVDGLVVNVHSYGASMPLNQLATIQAPDARLLVITPWDKTTLGDIEKAIIGSGLGLTPSNDGKLIRLPIPPLTNERRQELVRQVRREGEDTKVRVRHVRREYNEVFKEAEKSGEIPEDACRRYLTTVQERTDAAVAKVDEIVNAKESELLEV
jgi:ribosome recycling factor